MDDPTKIIREASHVALETFADSLEQETSLALPECRKRILAEILDHSFHSYCRTEVEKLVDKYLEDEE